MPSYVKTTMALQDFYNFNLDSGNDPIYSTKAKGSSKGLLTDKYSNYLQGKKFSLADSAYDDIPSLMNGPIREKLQIIPKNVS